MLARHLLRAEHDEAMRRPADDAVATMNGVGRAPVAQPKNYHALRTLRACEGAWKSVGSHVMACSGGPERTVSRGQSRRCGRPHPRSSLPKAGLADRRGRASRSRVAALRGLP